MDTTKLQSHILNTMTQFAAGIQHTKKYEGFRATLTASGIYRRLKGMFGITQGKVNYALRQLTADGKIVAVGNSSPKKYVVAE